MADSAADGMYCPVVPKVTLYASRKEHDAECPLMFGAKFRSCPACNSRKRLTCFEYIDHKRECTREVTCHLCDQNVLWCEMSRHLHTQHKDRHDHHFSNGGGGGGAQENKKQPANNKTTSLKGGGGGYQKSSAHLVPPAHSKNNNNTNNNNNKFCETCNESKEKCACAYCTYCKSSWKKIDDPEHLLVCERQITCSTCKKQMKISEKLNNLHICIKEDPMMDCLACNEPHKVPRSQLESHRRLYALEPHVCMKCQKGGIARCEQEAHLLVCEAPSFMDFNGPQFVLLQELIDRSRHKSSKNNSGSGGGGGGGGYIGTSTAPNNTYRRRLKIDPKPLLSVPAAPSVKKEKETKTSSSAAPTTSAFVVIPVKPETDQEEEDEEKKTKNDLTNKKKLPAVETTAAAAAAAAPSPTIDDKDNKTWIAPLQSSLSAQKTEPEQKSKSMEKVPIAVPASAPPAEAEPDPNSINNPGIPSTMSLPKPFLPNGGGNSGGESEKSSNKN